MRAPANCSKCGGKMSKGFMVDHAHAALLATSWHAGEAEKSWFGGVKTTKDGQIQVQTFRCDRCGYLESYAVKG